jgi:hypothetical protein
VDYGIAPIGRYKTILSVSLKFLLTPVIFGAFSAKQESAVFYGGAHTCK